MPKVGSTTSGVCLLLMGRELQRRPRTDASRTLCFLTIISVGSLGLLISTSVMDLGRKNLLFSTRVFEGIIRGCIWPISLPLPAVQTSVYVPWISYE